MVLKLKFIFFQSFSRFFERLSSDKNFNPTIFIGYGNVVPLTNSGKVFTIFIALLGIPLNIVILAKIGNILKITVNYLLRPIEKRLKNHRYFLLIQVRKINKKTVCTYIFFFVIFTTLFQIFRCLRFFQVNFCFYLYRL
jgi:hypothetical protein